MRIASWNDRRAIFTAAPQQFSLSFKGKLEKVIGGKRRSVAAARHSPTDADAKFREAEPLLLTAHEAMHTFAHRDKSPTRTEAQEIVAAIRRLVELYTVQQKTEPVAAWSQRLKAAEQE